MGNVTVIVNDLITVTGELPTQRASKTEMFPFDDEIIIISQKNRPISHSTGIAKQRAYSVVHFLRDFNHQCHLSIDE